MTVATPLPAAIGTVHDAPSARDLENLVRDNMPMVGHLVRELLNRVPGHVHADDLSSAGFAALLGVAGLRHAAFLQIAAGVAVATVIGFLTYYVDL